MGTVEHQSNILLLRSEQAGANEVMLMKELKKLKSEVLEKNQEDLEVLKKTLQNKEVEWAKKWNEYEEKLKTTKHVSSAKTENLLNHFNREQVKLKF